jgi:hypothetical protein
MTRGERVLPLALGIDIGTSAVKICALDTDGGFDVHSFSEEQRSATRAASRLDVTEMTTWIWAGVKRLIGEMCWRERITAVAITAHGQSGLLVRGRRAVGEMIPWWADIDVEIIDEQAALLQELLDGDSMDVVINPRGTWLPARLVQWVRLHPHVKLGDRLISLQLKDLLNLQLTGEAGSDSRSMRGLLDSNGEIPASLVDWIGITDLVPRLGTPGEQLGTVDFEGEELSGIPVGIPVAFGLDDFSAGIAGLVSPDEEFGEFSPLLNLANTSEHLAVVAGLPAIHRNSDTDREELSDGEGGTVQADQAELTQDLGTAPESAEKNLQDDFLLGEMRERALMTGLTFLPADASNRAILYSSTNSGGQTLLNTLPRLPGAPNSGDSGQEWMSSVMMWLEQIMGEMPTSAEMASVPEFDAQIHGSRGLDPNPRAIGGWAGIVDDVEATPSRLLAWRIFDSLIDSLEPVRAALKPFTDHSEPVRIGGGLATMTKIIESRAARWQEGIEVAAGAEVSALGAARIAQGLI